MQGTYTVTQGEYRTLIRTGSTRGKFPQPHPSPTLSLNGMGLLLWHTDDPIRNFLIGQVRVGATTAVGDDRIAGGPGRRPGLRSGDRMIPR